MWFIAIGLILLVVGVYFYLYMIRSHNLVNNSIDLAYFTFVCIGFPSAFLWQGVLSFYAPRWAQRLDRKLFFRLTLLNRAIQKRYAVLSAKQRLALSVSTVVQMTAVGAFGAFVPLLLAAVVGLFAPPYAGPIPPVTALQKAHSEATQLWQAMASRPVSYVVLVGVLIGSWVAIRVCRRVRKRITGDDSFFPRLRPLSHR